MHTELLPAWALNHLNEQLSPFAHVVNVLPAPGAGGQAFLVNTSRGAVLLRKRRFGEPEHWLLPLPGTQVNFTCQNCSERMELVDPEVPRPLFCSRCGREHTLNLRDGELVLDDPTRAIKNTRDTKAPAKQTASAYRDYKGDVHPVIELEGIGPKWAERLQGLGIETTARLSFEDGQLLAKRLGASPKVVASWQAMAELVKVTNIGPQYAEALVRSGITSIKQLKRLEAGAIAKQVNAYLDSLDVNVLGQRITAKRVAGWQRKAASMRRVAQSIPPA